MALASQLFTQPRRNQRLDKCLVDDAWHIKEGQSGDHALLIQRALNKLSAGPGRENFKLKEDGVYGPRTGDAVQAYKNAPSRRILQSWQKTADKVVGKRTIESLDNEMQIDENMSPASEGLVASDHLGFPHDHSKCQRPKRDGQVGPDGKISHIATPMNPRGGGRKISIGGDTEVGYLGFEDFVPDPAQDPSMRAGYVMGRPFTRSLPSRSCSDICFRSTPIDLFMQKELKRIAMVGCRLTYASNYNSFFGLDTGTLSSTMQYLRSLGPILEHSTVFEPITQQDRPELDAFTVIVVSMVHLN